VTVPTVERGLCEVAFCSILQELPRVRRQRLDVAPLAFGVERVEREGGFAGAGKARDHHESVARNVDADILEVMRSRAADANRFHRAIC
jgi:hypothetical protein